MKLFPGMVISCRIYGKKVDRATITAAKRGCLKMEGGPSADDPVAWTWYFQEKNPWLDGVTGIQVLARSLADGLFVGDEISNPKRGGTALVLAVLGEAVLLTAWGDHSRAVGFFTIGELVHKGCELTTGLTQQGPICGHGPTAT